MALAAPPDEASSADAAQPAAAQLEFFEKQIRPLLIQHCHKCHGDQPEPKGGLRLLSRGDLLTGGDSGPAVVPGNLDDSLLIEAVRYGPDSYQMPPSGKLSDAEIAALEQWVKEGAAWPAEVDAEKREAKAAFDLRERLDHWCWQPLVDAGLPEVRQSAWPRQALDRFILAGLEAAGLEPALEADRAVWLRRVTFDLIGLPPAPEEIADFLADDAPDAYERVVERLLASPHYGERWARHWLDLVRYAETHGHEFDYDIENAWQYRDYVIRAFNADVPYDQFVVEHVAGDLVDPPRRHPAEGFNESIIGAGFFHFGDATHSPVDIRGDEADRIDNQIDVFSKAFLGLTVSCARCHDHKFDAISTQDYYALVGFLRSSRYQQAFLDGPELNARAIAALVEAQEQAREPLARYAADAWRIAIEQLPAMLLAARDALSASEPTAAETLSAVAERHGLTPQAVSGWVEHLQRAAQNPADPWHPWTVLAGDASLASPEQFAAAAHALAARLSAAGQPTGESFASFADGGYGAWQPTGDAFGDGPTLGNELLLAQAVLQWLPAGVAHSGRASGRLRGVLRSPTFAIEHPRIAYRAGGRGLIRLVVDSHRVIFGPLHGGLNLKIDSPDRLQWHVQDVSEYLGHRGHIELVDESDSYLAVDEVRFCDGDAPRDRPNPRVIALLEQSHLHSAEALADAYRRLLQSVATADPDHYTEDEAAGELANWMLAHPALLSGARLAGTLPAELAALLDRHRQLEGELRQQRRALALADGTAEDVAVHVRGNHKQLGQIVPRRFLEALGGVEQPIASAGSGRLELARQMVAPANPLLPRVIVNRLWLYHFGAGLVGSPDDFGLMGQAPTHPELLDFLAAELIRQRWSLKALHRQMALSATYRMSSRPSAEAARIDPSNRLWQHMPVRRLEAEAIRDSVLAVSGRLDRGLFGPSVPVYLTEFMSGRGRPQASGPLDGSSRRSIYQAVRRNFMNPLLTAFDFPQPSTTIGKRNVSNVPAQGLALMNDPFVIEQAAHWSAALLASSDDTDARIERMYLTAFARPPSAGELAAAREFVTAQEARYAEASAASDSATSAAPDDGQATASERQAWSDLCHALFSAKEFLFVE